MPLTPFAVGSKKDFGRGWGFMFLSTRHECQQTRKRLKAKTATAVFAKGSLRESLNKQVIGKPITQLASLYELSKDL